MRIVFVTCPPGAGEVLLGQLIQENLVAGGNIVSGVQSLYRWKGEVCADPEEILLMETAADRVEVMIARLAAIHPYDVPKIVTFDVAEHHTPYLEWVRAMTRPGAV